MRPMLRRLRWAVPALAAVGVVLYGIASQVERMKQASPYQETELWLVKGRRAREVVPHGTRGVH